MLFSFRQNISTFCLQNSDFIGGFPIRPAWDAYDISKDFIDYWDDVINIWLGKKDKTLNKYSTVTKSYDDEEGKLNVEIEKEQAEWFNVTDKLRPSHIPEPYWGDPCNCSIVIVNYNPGGGTGENRHTYRGKGDSYPDNTMVKYVNENKYSQLAKDCPILKKKTDCNEHSWFCGYEGWKWWDKKKKWIQHLEESIPQEKDDSQDAKDSLPFCIDLCAWHSHQWRYKKKDIFDNSKLKDSITERFVAPLLYAIEKSDCHLAVCIGAMYSSEFFQKIISKYTFRDLTKDIYYKQLKSSAYNVQPPKDNALKNIDKSIEVTIKAKGKETTRYYRVYNIYNEKEGKNHIILNTFSPGGNHHPAQTFWGFEKDLLTAIKSYL